MKTRQCCAVFFFLFLAAEIPMTFAAQKIIIPNNTWVKIYFEEIDRLAKIMKIKNLRSVRLQPEVLEVRVWWGFGISSNGGMVFKRVGKRWAAASMVDPRHTTSVNGRFVEPSVKQGPANTDWAQTWERLKQAGILDIKDDSEIPHCQQILDGICYVVEIAQPDFYRTYLVANPELQRSEDGDKFLRLLDIIQEAFGGQPTDPLAELPTGEEKAVASFSSEISISSNILGVRPDGSEYKIGNIPPENLLLRLAPEEVLAQGINLDFSQCSELPVPWRYIALLAEGEVVMDLFIGPDGSVAAAKAISGTHVLAENALRAASKWKFKPLNDSEIIRNTRLSIRYQKKWVPFPWLR
jgi:hypothetical protein